MSIDRTLIQLFNFLLVKAKTGHYNKIIKTAQQNILLIEKVTNLHCQRIVNQSSKKNINTKLLLKMNHLQNRIFNNVFKISNLFHVDEAVS